VEWQGIRAEKELNRGWGGQSKAGFSSLRSLRWPHRAMQHACSHLLPACLRTACCHPFCSPSLLTRLHSSKTLPPPPMLARAGRSWG